jgi:chromosome segregation ATPase
MTTPILKRNNRGFFPRAGAVLRGQRGWLHVEDYHVGDIHSDTPVMIAATMAGNVLAPKVVVAGLLYGMVAALEVIVEGNGQVWGDVYAHSVRLEGGGKVHGWISTLDVEVYHSLRAGDTHLPDPALPPNIQLPAELQSNRPDGDGAAGVRYAMLRRLQVETATALVARAELEDSFENRVVEIAGESLSEATHLREQVSSSRSELLALTTRLEEAQERLQLREDQNTQQAKELATVRELLAERAATQEVVQQEFDRQKQAFDQLQMVRHLLDDQLKSMVERADRLAERVNNLEGALQASLQHSAEQEDSLVRWQELAEVTEQRANQLAREVESHKLQLTESSRLVELMRGQREKMQAQWEQANGEIEALKKRLAEAEAQWVQVMSQQVKAEEERAAAVQQMEAAVTELAEQHQQSTAEMETMRRQAAAELDSLRLRAEAEKESLRAELEARPALSPETVAALEEAQARVVELEERLVPAERQAARMEAMQRQMTELQNRLAEAQIARVALDVARQKFGELEVRMELALAERDDQLLWYKASMGMTAGQLETVRQWVAAQEAEAQALRAELEALRSQTEQERDNIVRLTELLHEAEQKAKTAGDEAAAAQASLAAEKQELKTSLRQRQLQLEASEAEIEHYHQEIENQRRRLAELQATLIEREVALSRAVETAGQQNQQLAKIKQLAGRRIQTLEGELKRTHQQLTDLTAYLERRQKKT